MQQIPKSFAEISKSQIVILEIFRVLNLAQNRPLQGNSTKEYKENTL